MLVSHLKLQTIHNNPTKFSTAYCTSNQAGNSQAVDKNIVNVLTAREEFSYHIKIRSD